VDVLRTPLYSLAMEVIGIVGLITSVFYPPSVYKAREIIGKLEILLYRLDEENDDYEFAERSIIPFLFGCFGSMGNIKTKDIRKFAKAHLKFQRKNKVPINCCKKLKKTPYTSPWIGTKLRTPEQPLISQIA
jgi:hypothetical protein